MQARQPEMRSPFLASNFGPLRSEVDAPHLEVVGEIPRDLCGTYYRNGPNPAYEPLGPYHWFDGDGMIHAIHLEDGRARYKNRFVRSRGLEEERAAGRALYPGILGFSPGEAPRLKNTANTNIVAHAGKLLALQEASLPTELVPCLLDTVGEYDFAGALTGPMTAHPKIDPESGEMFFFGYSPFPPYLQFHVADRGGRLVRSESIDVAWPSMIHDFAVTEHHVIFLLCPIVFDFGKVATLGTPFTWEPERGTRIGILPRAGSGADVRWLETDPCYVFHPMNAYEDGGDFILDVARYEELLFMHPRGRRRPADGEYTPPHLYRWHIDPRAGTVRGQALDDLEGEFPRVDERRVGRRHRFGTMAVAGPEGKSPGLPLFTAIRRYDLDRGSSQTRALGAENGAGEPIFVPRHDGAAEDDGYVMALVYDRRDDRSELLILDAADIAGEPLARVRLPNRVPYGFHGNWVAA